MTAPETATVAKRRGWGCNRFEIKAFTDGASLTMNYPATDDTNPHALPLMIAALKDCLVRLEAVQASQKAVSAIGDSR